MLKLIVLTAIATLLLATGCSQPDRIVQVRVVQIYMEDCDANDGTTETDWMTVVEDVVSLRRAKWFGKFGETNDIFSAQIGEYGLCP